MKKKLISYLLIICLLCSLFPMTSPKANAEDYSGTCGDDISWTLDVNTGVLTFSGTGGMINYSSSDSPWYPYRSSIKRVIVGSGITTISISAFRDHGNLESVSLPDTLTHIPISAFENCRRLTEITIPGGVTSINTSAFKNCAALIRVLLPSSMGSIYYNAFQGCTSLNHVLYTGTEAQWANIKNAVGMIWPGEDESDYPSTILGKTCHYEAKGDEIEIHDFCTGFVGYCTLCRENVSYYEEEGKTHSYSNGCCTACGLPEGLEYTVTGDPYYVTITNYTGTASSLELPSHIYTLPVSRIGNSAFSGADSLTSVTIPDGIYTIDNYAFSGCDNLCQVNIGSSAQNIGTMVFQGCPKLTGIWVAEENEFFSSDSSGVLYNKEKTTLLRCPGGFAGVYSIPSGVNSISSYAFAGCAGLTAVSIPDGVTGIGAYAFSGATGLETLRIPNSVTSLGNAAFNNCTALTKAEIGSGVTSFDAYLFAECTALTEVHVSESNPALWSDDLGVVYSKDKTKVILCPGGFPGQTYSIANGVSRIAENAFRYCDHLVNVTIPGSVTYIESNVFSDCDKLCHLLYTGTEAQWSEITMESQWFEDGVSNSLCYFRHDGANGDEVCYKGSEGYEYLYCNLCEKALTDGCLHENRERRDAIEATCSQMGYSGNLYCTDCGALLEAGEVVPTKEHSYDSVATAATCTEGGFTTYTCLTCGDSYIADEIAALGHSTETEPQKLPTCTQAGQHSYTCTRCGQAQVETIAALGHDFIPVPGYHPTCTEPGLTAGAYCSRCDKSYEQKGIPATGHDYSYTIDGREHTATCRNGCGSSHTQRHSFVEGVCICGAVRESTQVALTLGHTVSFDSDLQMNYRIKYTDLAAAVPAYVTEGAYLVVEKDRYSNDGSTSVETVILQPDLNADATRMVFSLPGIQSVEMGSELRAVLHFFDDEGYEFITTVDVYSVLAYAELCYDTFEYEFQPKLYTLLIDALNYGAAAQKHFNRRADCPVNAGMEAYQQYATQTLSETLTDVKTYVENDRSITAVTNMGFTVAFADRTELNVKLTLADGYTKEDITAVAVYDAAGQEVDRLTEFTELSDGRLQVTFRKIKSVNLRDMYYFVAFVGDQPASGQIGYSVEAYAKSILASDDLDLAAMVQCCIYYGDAAVACFGK